MKVETKQLSYDMIEKSPEILSWLSQFDDSKRKTAISLLSQLRFVTRDVYSAWLLDKLTPAQFGKKSAIYAVRKFPDDQSAFWDDKGEVINRPSISQGSEDFVYSLVANAVRDHRTTFFDHPSLGALKDEQIHDIVLIDDSIGSGNRVSGFIKSMMISKTLKSWSSFGLIKICIIAFARTKESEKYIISNTLGSDHARRKYRKSSKFTFVSKIVYSKESLVNRWGVQWQNILELCDSETKVNKKWRRGFGRVMGNIVFYHSVPNNIPGVLFCNGSRWKQLMARSGTPQWLRTLLDSPRKPGKDKSSSVSSFTSSVPGEIIQLLLLVKRGVRNSYSLALRMDCEHCIIRGMLERVAATGLVTNKTRLTEAGLKILKQKGAKEDKSQVLNYDLYIPEKWCTGQVTVQPPALKKATSLGQADSAENTSVDGEIGQVSLEKTDAKTASPSLNVSSHQPSGSRKRPDTHGPKGLKET